MVWGARGRVFESLRPDHIIQGVARSYLATLFYFRSLLPPQIGWLSVESCRCHGLIPCCCPLVIIHVVRVQWFVSVRVTSWLGYCGANQTKCEFAPLLAPFSRCHWHQSCLIFLFLSPLFRMLDGLAKRPVLRPISPFFLTRCAALNPGSSVPILRS